MQTSHHKVSRRQFLNTAAGAVSILLLDSSRSYAGFQHDGKVKAIVAKAIGIDTHNHMDVPFSKIEFAGRQYNLESELKISRLIAICMTFCVDRPELKKEVEAFERFLISLDEMDEMLRSNQLNRALNFNDLKKARKENKRIVIQAVEGAHFIEGKPERIKIAYDRGIRHLGLMHYNQTTPPMGDIYRSDELKRLFI